MLAAEPHLPRHALPRGAIPLAAGPVRGALDTSASVGSRARILLVDDDASIRQVGEMLLGHFGYEVETAADGAAAWKALHESNYDLLITDHDMPKKTGLELARQVRLAGMPMPIVLVSGRLEALGDPSVDRLALAGRLAKPFGAEALIETVHSALAGAGRQGGLADAPTIPAQARLTRIQPFFHGGINE